MKKTKFSVLAVSVALLLSSCGGVSNTAKGGMIGGASGGALGALIGQLIGNGKGAAIGAAVGATVGGATGVIIGHKMDKAKAAAEAANAQAEVLTDANGTQYVKATFDSGLLFATGSSTLSAEAKASIQKFVTQLAAEDNTFNLAVCGYTDNAGWANSTVAEEPQPLAAACRVSEGSDYCRRLSRSSLGTRAGLRRKQPCGLQRNGCRQGTEPSCGSLHPPQQGNDCSCPAAVNYCHTEQTTET